MTECPICICLLLVWPANTSDDVHVMLLQSSSGFTSLTLADNTFVWLWHRQLITRNAIVVVGACEH